MNENGIYLETFFAKKKFLKKFFEMLFAWRYGVASPKEKSDFFIFFLIASSDTLLD